MKKLLFLLLLTPFFTSQAQVIFEEDFDNIPGSTAGGAGTYAFPSGWTLANVDNLTTSTSVAYINDAWERREDFITGVGDSCAFSTSWYVPAGTANDWMWTPAIALPASSKLSWRGFAPDPSFLDGYEVRIMTTPPTGSTGNIGNMITSSTVLFSTTAEANSWTTHEVNLSAYSGQTVYIGFRNNSTDKFVLLIDDIVVSQVVSNDISITSINTIPEYTQIPFMFSQNVTTPGATLLNSGLNVLTSPKLNVEIEDEFGMVIYSDSVSYMDSLWSTQSIYLSTQSFSPASEGTYIIHYRASMNETDNDNSNDTMSSVSFNISDTVYARDNGVITQTLGIGAGNGGYMGQDFYIKSPVYASSISLQYSKGYTGEPFAAVIWNMNTGIPDTIVASTDTLYYPNDSAMFYTINMNTPNGAILLDTGYYAVTVIEFDSTLSVALSGDIFTSGHTWVNWPTNPLGTWANNEDFGFSSSYVLRLNIADPCISFVLDSMATPATCATCADGSATITPTGGFPPYSYIWDTGDTTASIFYLLPGTYNVTVTDSLGCMQTASVTILNSVDIENHLLSVSVFPNPSNGDFTVHCTDISSSGALLEIYDVSGKLVHSELMLKEEIMIKGLASGVYNMQIKSDNEIITRKILIQ